MKVTTWSFLLLWRWQKHFIHGSVFLLRCPRVRWDGLFHDTWTPSRKMYQSRLRLGVLKKYVSLCVTVWNVCVCVRLFPVLSSSTPLFSDISLCSYISCASVFAFALHLWGSVFLVRVCDPVLFHEIRTVYHSRAFPIPLISYCSIHSCLKKDMEDFPGGLVVGSLAANERDTGSTPGLGRSHMLCSNKAHEPQLLSLCSRACVLQLLKPECHNYWTHAP